MASTTKLTPSTQWPKRSMKVKRWIITPDMPAWTFMRPKTSRNSASAAATPPIAHSDHWGRVSLRSSAHSPPPSRTSWAARGSGSDELNSLPWRTARQSAASDAPPCAARSPGVPSGRLAGPTSAASGATVSPRWRARMSSSVCAPPVLARPGSATGAPGSAAGAPWVVSAEEGGRTACAAAGETAAAVRVSAVRSAIARRSVERSMVFPRSVFSWRAEATLSDPLTKRERARPRKAPPPSCDVGEGRQAPFCP